MTSIKWRALTGLFTLLCAGLVTWGVIQTARQSVPQSAVRTLTEGEIGEIRAPTIQATPLVEPCGDSAQTGITRPVCRVESKVLPESTGQTITDPADWTATVGCPSDNPSSTYPLTCTSSGGLGDPLPLSLHMTGQGGSGLLVEIVTGDAPCRAQMEAAMRAMEPFLPSEHFPVLIINEQGEYEWEGKEHPLGLLKETLPDLVHAREQWALVKQACWGEP